jgi:hypothetical protein
MLELQREGPSPRRRLTANIGSEHRVRAKADEVVRCLKRVRSKRLLPQSLEWAEQRLTGDQGGIALYAPFEAGGVRQPRCLRFKLNHPTNSDKRYLSAGYRSRN